MVKILNQSCEDMSFINSGSVDLVVTSPPYYNIKDYGCSNQIGYGESYGSYCSRLATVWDECIRVTKPGCKICINVGDQFNRSTSGSGYSVLPIRESIVEHMMDSGVAYCGAIIWQKFTNSNPNGGGKVMGSYLYPRNGVIRIDYEFILIFKTQGLSEKVSKEVKEKSKMTKEEWNTCFKGHWNFPGDNHGFIAAFPLELPYRLIKMYSFYGETVLDPFMGSGTTLAAALKLDRDFIGYEINSEFIAKVPERVESLIGVKMEKIK